MLEFESATRGVPDFVGEWESIRVSWRIVANALVDQHELGAGELGGPLSLRINSVARPRFQVCLSKT